MKYEELEPISKENVLKALQGTDNDASEGLIRAALSIDDAPWVESVLTDALSDGRFEVRRAAILSLGHLARIHRRITLEKVIPLLQNCANDPSLAGSAEDALGDIAMFVRPRTS